jgi:hypothetical protein
LEHSRRLGLTYYRNSNPELIGYSDSGHTGDRDDRKLIFGYAFMLQGAVVLWKSNKQTMVTLSSMEEYVGSSEAARQGI